MGLPLYLAMTAAELACQEALPSRIAYMACHFAPYGTGLTDLPDIPVHDQVVILNDRIPPGKPDVGEILEILTGLSPAALLLDFQEDTPACRVLAETLLNNLACPVALPPLYARHHRSIVFAGPVAPYRHLADFLSPWKGREIWLDLSAACATATVTRDGVRFSAACPPEGGTHHRDSRLHCCYETLVSEENIRFTLWRDREDLALLMEEAAGLGVTRGIGLYQELAPMGF